ncbi:MAG: hypothetical protein ACERKN_03295 [Velocimicrobium sp.]
MSNFLIELAAIFLCCSALTLLFFHGTSLSKSYHLIKEFISSSDVFYETQGRVDGQKEGVEDNSIAKQDLIITLVSGLTYDIELDGDFYLKDSFDYAAIDCSVLADFYKKKYLYDETGCIQMIRYTREGSNH